MGEQAQGHIVELKRVKKSFGSNLVLDGIDLAIARGEAVVVAGPSGSGKSTMLRCINALETIDEGDVLFEGRSIPAAGRGVHNIRAEMGMVFQSFNLFPHKTVKQNITIGPRQVKNVSEDEANRKAEALLERVGIPEKADQFPADLSGGQQQRVAIARALRDGAEADAVRRTDVRPRPRDDPRGARRDARPRPRGHDDDRRHPRDGVRREVCDRVVFIDDGVIIEEAPPEEFFSNAKSKRAKDFVDKVLHH